MAPVMDESLVAARHYGKNRPPARSPFVQLRQNDRCKGSSRTLPAN